MVNSEISPTARALLALEVLQTQPGITADRLADRLGITPRAVRRQIAILREAGIPVSAVSGPAGGYRLGRGLRLPPLLFSPTEALGLVMAVLDGHHRAADPADPVGSALGKILRALPDHVAAQAEAVRRAAAPAADRGAARPDPDTTAVLVSACSDSRQVRLSYRSESGSSWDLDVEPWAVVVRHSRWYLLCRSVSADAIRAYRIDRVHAVRVLDVGFDPPLDLDPVHTLEQHLGAGWEYAADVVIQAPLERCRRLLPPVLGRLEELDEETTRLVGSTANPYWYAEQLARIPVPYRIDGGVELRSTARDLAERMLAALTTEGSEELLSTDEQAGERDHQEEADPGQSGQVRESGQDVGI